MEDEDIPTITLIQGKCIKCHKKGFVGASGLCLKCVGKLAIQWIEKHKKGETRK